MCPFEKHKCAHLNFSIVLYRSIKIEGYHTWIRDDFFMMMIMTMMTVVEKGLYKSSSVWTGVGIVSDAPAPWVIPS